MKSGQTATAIRLEIVRSRAIRAGYPSVEALARAAGLSYGHLWRCLSGRQPAGPKVITGLLRALPNLTFDELVDDRPAPASLVTRPTLARVRVLPRGPGSPPAA